MKGGLGYDPLHGYFRNVLPYQFWSTPLITALIIILGRCGTVDNKPKTAARVVVSRLCLACQEQLDLDKSHGWLEDTSVRFLLPCKNISHFQGNM